MLFAVPLPRKRRSLPPATPDVHQPPGRRIAPTTRWTPRYSWRVRTSALVGVLLLTATVAAEEPALEFLRGPGPRLRRNRDRVPRTVAGLGPHAQGTTRDLRSRAVAQLSRRRGRGLQCGRGRIADGQIAGASRQVSQRTLRSSRSGPRHGIVGRPRARSGARTTAPGRKHQGHRAKRKVLRRGAGRVRRGEASLRRRDGPLPRTVRATQEIGGRRRRTATPHGPRGQPQTAPGRRGPARCRTLLARVSF